MGEFFIEVARGDDLARADGRVSLLLTEIRICVGVIVSIPVIKVDVTELFAPGW